MQLLRRNKSAFTVTEILGVIILLSAFLVVAGHLLHTSTLLTHESGLAMSRANQRQVILEILRRDVWTAKQISSPTPNQLRIATDDQQAISWEISTGGKITRSLGKDQQHFELQAAQWSFHSDEAATIVHAGSEGEIALINERKLVHAP